MRRLLPLLLFACSAGESSGPDLRPPPDGGAFERPDAAVEPGGDTATRLFFVADGKGYVARPDGTQAAPFCPAERLIVDRLGERALCVPAADQPLVLYDVVRNDVLARIEAWETPFLSPAGERVAFVVPAPNGANVVYVVDSNGEPVASLDAFGVRGWASEQVLLIDGPPVQLWTIGGARRDVEGRQITPVGPEPAGAAATLRDGDRYVAFVPPEGDPVRLVDGVLLDVAGTEVLGLTTTNDVFWADAADPMPQLIERPGVPITATLAARFARPGQVIFEIERPRTCEQIVELGTRQSYFLDIATGEVETLAETEGPHRVHVARSGKALLVLLDGCAIPTGSVSVVEGDDARSLDEHVPGGLTDATLSADGRYVALGYEAGVVVVDLSTDMAQQIATEGPAGQLLFR